MGQKCREIVRMCKKDKSDGYDKVSEEKVKNTARRADEGMTLDRERLDCCPTAAGMGAWGVCF